MNNAAYNVLDFPPIKPIQNKHAVKETYNKIKPFPKAKIKAHRIPVQPLIGEDIQRAKDYLFNKPEVRKATPVNLRNYTLFTFNINIGLRISDLLALKISDIMIDNNIVDVFIVTEQKTGKDREIPVRTELKEILINYLNSIGDWEYDWYLFHGVWPQRTPHKQMNRRNVSFIMKDIEKALGLKVPLGTHSMRKTFARRIFDVNEAKNNGLGIQAVQQVLHHSSEAMARKYIGLTREHEMSLYLDGELI